MRLSQKQIDSIGYQSKVDIFEGASGTGKSQAAKMKLILKINESDRKQHFIAGESAPVTYRNLIDDDLGITTLFKNVRHGTDKKKGNYLSMTDTKGRLKLIYVFGYGDEAKWKKVLGGTVGCGLIDEANLAPIGFITQVFRGLTRPDANYWLGFTLNPASPNHDVYKRYINKARPLKKYLKDIPQSIIEELRKVEANHNYTYWHFNHKDNPALTDEAVEELKSALLPGSPEWLSLIEGVRSVGEGSVWGKYLNDSYLIKDLSQFKMVDYDGQIVNSVKRFSFGLDIGSNSDGSAKTVLCFTAFTNRYKDVIPMYLFKTTETETNAIIKELVTFIKPLWESYGYLIEGVYSDDYGIAKMIVETLRDELKKQGIYLDVLPTPKFNDGGRKPRKQVMDLLIGQHRIHFMTTELYSQLKQLVYDKKELGMIKDDNTYENDCYDALTYSFLHNIEEIRGAKYAD